MALTDPNIIGDVTTMLVDLLNDVNVTLDSPAELKATSSNPENLNLYLFQVIENPYGKNREWSATSPTEQKYPPLALSLHYMLTPYATDLVSAHHVLGQAMRVLHDHSVLKDAELPDAVRNLVEQVAIILTPMKLEGLTRIWNALQSPYRLSVCYEVKVVLLESLKVRTVGRVSHRINQYSQI